MAALNGAGAGYARFYWAVEVTLRLPWFVVNTIVEEGGARYVRSLNCAWERDVADLCLPKKSQVVLSIQQLVPDHAVPAGWTIRQIVKVWRGRRFVDQEVVIFEDDDGMEFSGEHGAAPPADVTDRKLLFSRVVPSGSRRATTKRKAGLRRGAPVLDRLDDPCAKLSASQIGKLLGGLDAAQVAALESRGDLFSVPHNGARAYPAYQASPSLPRGCVSRILTALKAYGQSAAPEPFFMSLNPDLDKLSPVEVLLGGLLRERDVHDDVPAMLGASADDRASLVVAAAEAYAAVLWGS